jgi:hypothetical protein
LVSCRLEGQQLGVRSVGKGFAEQLLLLIAILEISTA